MTRALLSLLSYLHCCVKTLTKCKEREHERKNLKIMKSVWLDKAFVTPYAGSVK